MIVKPANGDHQLELLKSNKELAKTIKLSKYDKNCVKNIKLVN